MFYAVEYLPVFLKCFSDRTEMFAASCYIIIFIIFLNDFANASFQNCINVAELFDKFLHGSSLEECYSAVASVANWWLDLLDNQGKDIADSELLDYISESSTMSKSLADYGEQKLCAVTTAKRLADFLGDTMGTPVSERAVPVPVAIFETDTEIMKFYVKKWCKISSDVGIRSIVDWSYYKQRLSSAVQKIITIPAAMQKVANPVPRVVHPDWLHKKVREKEDKFRQRKLVDIFSSSNKEGRMQPRTDANAPNHAIDEQNFEDVEDFRKKGRTSVVGPRPIIHCYGVNNEQHPVKTNCLLNLPQQIGCGGSLSELLIHLQENAIPKENIDRNVDYQGWLELKKRKWKETREKRKRQRLDKLKALNQTNAIAEVSGSVVNHKQARGRNGVNSYFEKHELALMGNHWQIIQLVPSSKHGQFFAWVVVEGTMRKITLSVPRVFYLNSKLLSQKNFLEGNI
ncbi:unnamed protein product [Ilex paraguariensis]|uniref:DNA polymerase epsilon catalytic subunit n=1 Tax=Ilex paraguariensis TaxID=185542 RepID=A0ABC8SGG4_9AQUA